MGKAKFREQYMFIKKMAKGSVADVMQQGRNAQKFLKQRRGKGAGIGSGKARVKMEGKSAGDMHGSQRMDKAGMFGGWENQTGALELKNRPQAL